MDASRPRWPIDLQGGVWGDLDAITFSELLVDLMSLRA
jgi:hypothetical protein